MCKIEKVVFLCKIEVNFTPTDVIALSACLFQLLGAETCVCLKVGRKYAFGEAETKLLYKSCVLGEGINTQDSYGPLEVHKQKVECAFEWYPLGSAEKYQITLDKWLQFSRSPHSSHLISLLCPLNNKFPNLNTKKSITNSQIN